MTTATRAWRVAVSGATRNFFKVGHTTLRTLAALHPEIQLRLGVPDPAGAAPACSGMPVELVSWDPADPTSLAEVFSGAQALLMVPPIQSRIRVARAYIEAAERAGIDYILCLGVQFHHPRLILATEANEVDRMLAASGIRHHTLHLPMFLENLLYQVPSVRDSAVFRFPCDPDAHFSYVNCWDLGEVAARLLASAGQSPQVGDTHWTASTQTSCRLLAELMSRALGKRVRFVPQSTSDFVIGLVSKGMSEHTARGVCQLWEEVSAGRDIPATATLARLLGHEPESAHEWVSAHACCFGGPGASGCAHPLPPPTHMF